MTSTAVTPALTADAARTLTDEVKADAAALWAKLLQLYEGQAHTALGYGSWGDYYAAEFGESGSRGYHLLDAARVRGEIERSTTVEPPASERVARELAPVLREDPEQVPEVWGEIVQEHGPQPTAAQVRETVSESLNNTRQQSPAPRRKPLPDLIESTTLTLHQTVHTLDTLTQDDRFSTYKNEVAPLLRNHLVNTIQACQKILDQLPAQPAEGGANA
jgi:hypothetical protein